jgi:ubiquinone/menaquinone biosynthesis C-methylase UbiE
MAKNTHKLELDHTKTGVRKYWDYGSKFYDDVPGFGGDEEHNLWKNYLSNAIGLEPKKVLDVGTGTGIVAMLLDELGHNVTGVDFSMGMMDVARNKAKASGADVKFLEGDVENLQFDDGTFDCITARYVLWTMTNPQKAIREWVRVVKPGGKIIIIEGKSVNKGALPRFSDKFADGLYRIYWFVKFGKNPFLNSYKKDIRQGLANQHGITKEQIIEYLSSAGVTGLNFSDLNAIACARRKRHPKHLKPSHGDNPTYLISGIASEKINN